MIYKYYSNISEYAINNFVNDKLCFSHVDQFNDSYEFNFQMEKALVLPDSNANKENELIDLLKFKNRVACFSLSEHLDNMWGYYANSDKGFCLGYDENEIMKIKGVCLRHVVYYSDIPIASYEDSIKNQEKLFVNMICHKKAEWICEQEVRAILNVSPDMMDSYEKEPTNLDSDKYEWRLVPHIEAFGIDDDTMYRAIQKNMIVDLRPKELIIGRRCDLEFENKLRKIASDKNISVFKR